jgi:hypothetical protein
MPINAKNTMKSNKYISTDVIAEFLEEDLLEFHFVEKAHEIGRKTVEDLHDWAVEYLGGHKCYLLVRTEPGTRLSEEARAYASSEEFDKISFADAIIRTDYNHEMAANFFIRFNRPGRTVRLFPDRAHAMAWIQGLKDGKG